MAAALKSKQIKTIVFNRTKKLNLLPASITHLPLMETKWSISAHVTPVLKNPFLI